MKKIKIFLLCLAASTVFGGCATSDGGEKLASGKMEEMLAEASAAANARQPEKAMSVLKTVTTSFPTEKAPWVQIAQMHFDGANYSEAITSAQEVLQRDPNDRLASSIIAVSGLRLSNKALADLSRQNNLSGSLRTEAQDLAKLLRETLGEPLLVPAPEPVKAKVTAPPPRAARGNKRVSNREAANVAASKPGDGNNTNPFGALK